MKKRYSMLALLLALVFLLSACGKSNVTEAPEAGEVQNETVEASEPAAEEAPAEEAPEAVEGVSDETLRLVIQTEPSYLLSLKGNYGGHRQVVSAICDTLIRYDSDTNTFEPSIATSWEWVDDTHLRFYIRDDVIAYDGTTLTADDILYSVARGVEGDAVKYWSPVNIDECYVEDEFTFVLGLHEIYPSIVGLLSNVYMLSIADESSVEANGGYEANTVKPYCTTGPYFLDEWKEGEYIRLVRNDNYWGEKAYYKYIEYTWIDDSASRTLAVAGGQADIAHDLSLGDIQSVESYEGCEGVLVPGGGAYVLFLNNTNEYLSDIRVREAIFHVLDPNAFSAIGSGGMNKTTDSLVATSDPYYRPAGDDYDQTPNIELAKQLLAEAGYADGFELSMTTNAAFKTMVEAIQASLMQIGITVNIEVVDMPAYFKVVDTGAYDMQYKETFADDVVNLCNMFDDRMELATRGGGTVGGYPELYETIDKCRYSLDEEERLDSYGDMQDFVRENYAMIPLYETSVLYAMNGSYDYDFDIGGHIMWGTVRPVA